MYDVKRMNIRRRLSALILSLCLALSFIPAPPHTAEAAYSDGAMDQLVNWGVISGYPDGSLRPERSLTRAEFVAMVNRAYGYSDAGETPFTDVPLAAWYHDDIGIAYNAGYFNGVSSTSAAPNKQLTREQALVLLARNMRLDPVGGEVTEFEDGREFADWSRGYIRAAKQAGMVGGYPDGTYRPKADITRGEMAVLLQRSLGTLINEPGTHTLSDVYGNVTINTTDTKLKDTTVTGNLYITGGLDLGDVTLENVRVLGDIIVAGGGESQDGKDSVVLRNVAADRLLVDSIADQYVSLRAEGNTEIAETVLRSDAFVQDRTRPGQGLLDISLESPDVPSNFTLSGNLENIVNRTPGSTLNIAMGTVDSLTIDEDATNAALNLDINSTVMNLNLDVATNVTGIGDIDKLMVSAAGSKIEMLPDTIEIRPGLTAEIAGEMMNAVQAQESSSDPRLLAGYPKVTNVAPTSATAVFSTNKAGTVYWAVSATVDGSVAEDELITPTEGNTIVTVGGNTSIEASNKEVTEALKSLTPDSNYYISTVLVDARNRHSPVKVASFLTPDNTTPAFNTGFPVVMQNDYTTEKDASSPLGLKRDDNGYPERNYHVQIAAMPNKTCQLYYAVYPKGSSAPTAQQFRTGALGGPLRSGVQDAIKNEINYIELYNLEELKDYDAYLCLIDADGARSSAVQKLTFTTIDGKPPRFQYDTPTVTRENTTSLTLNANVNEDATIFWVASLDDRYIKDPNKVAQTDPSWDGNNWWEHACRQIESGTNGARAGSVNARANADTTITISGLTAATGYYVYFVAKDKAGNYSEFTIENGQKTFTNLIVPFTYMLPANTLDNVPPTVEQSFDHYDTADPSRPYADTSIYLRFSEMVMRFSTNREKEREDFESFYDLYQVVESARKAYDASPTDANKQALKTARDALAETLRNTIHLYNNATIGNSSVNERTSFNETIAGDDWVVDYRNVKVEYDAETRVMTLVFPTVADDPSTPAVNENLNSALNLSSGSTYHFTLDDISDVSSSMNRMGHTQLPDFTTISAQVRLDPVNVTSLTDGTDIDMAFSMTPISVNVDDNVNWDLLFWSDSSVEFKVYELDLTYGTTNATGKPIRMVDKDGKVRTKDGTTPVDPTNAAIVNDNHAATNNTDYTGYLGRSLFRHLYGLTLNPSISGKGNVISSTDAELKASGTMELNEPKYYGIHFTSVNHISEDTGRDNGVWDATVKFRVSVLTGTSVDLGNLATNITNDNLNTYKEEWNVAEIQTAPTGLPFTMLKRFMNSAAPRFYSSYPKFTVTDTTLTMNVMLDRPGTIYWVVAPASTKTTDNTGVTTVSYSPTAPTSAWNGKAQSGLLTSSPVEYDSGVGKYVTTIGGYQTPVPTSGSDLVVPIRNADGVVQVDGSSNPIKDSNLYLTTPANHEIYTPNFGNSRIKSGLKAMSAGSDTITVEGLEPETIYLVYFVTQGTGPDSYSEQALLYSVTTEEVSRPRLHLTLPSTSYATVTSTNMDAVADYGLFLMDSLNDLATLKAKIYNATGDTSTVMSPEGLAFFQANYKGHTDDEGIAFNDYTVWQALVYEVPNRGSLFDLCASTDYKNSVAALIRAGTSSDGRVNGSNGIRLTQNTPSSTDYELETGLDYILFAVARSALSDANASGDSLGFGAAQPLFNRDMAQPKIKGITGRVVVDYTKEDADKTPEGFLLTGYVTLSFDRPLYLYDGSTTPPTRTPLKGDNIDDFLDADANDSGLVSVHTSTATTAVNSVRIDLAAAGVQNGTSFRVNGQLCGQYSSARDEFLQVSLNYDPSKSKDVVAVVTYPSVWFPDGASDIYTDVKAGAATGITLDSSSLTLQPGETVDLTATVSPAGGTGTIRWTVGAASTASITPMIGDKVTVTGGNVTSEKQTNITATLYNQSGTAVASANCLVTVTPIKVQTITLSKDSLTFTGAGMERITATVDPANAADTTIFRPPAVSASGKLNVVITPTAQRNVFYIDITRDDSFQSGYWSGTITFTSNDGAASVVLPVLLN